DLIGGLQFKIPMLTMNPNVSLHNNTKLNSLQTDLQSVAKSMRILKMPHMPASFKASPYQASLVSDAIVAAPEAIPESVEATVFTKADLDQAILVAVQQILMPSNPDPEAVNVPAESIEKRLEQDAPLRFKNALFLKQNYRYHKIQYQDILYLKADGNYTCVYTIGKTYLIKYSLQAFTSQFLDKDTFARVHRSFIINLEHISSFNETMATIEGTEIPIGPNFRVSFMKLFTS
ncbi:MAG: hypothetical protein EOO42_15915, partial [Flavobacteriales bacterium]